MVYSRVTESTVGPAKTFGQIMFESEVNNMAIFEAVLACDFHEIKGLNEGTILRSEVAALNEANFKSFKETIVKAWKALMKKIHELIDRAMDYIGNYIVKDGKKLAARWRENYAEKYNLDSNVTGDLELEVLDDEKCKNFTLEGLNIDLLANVGQDEDKTSASLLTAELSRRAGKDIESRAEFKAYATEKTIKVVSPTKELLEKMCKVLETGSVVKDLKELKGKVSEAFAQGLKKMEDNGSTELEAKDFEAYSSAYQTVIQIYSDLSIKFAKDRLRLAHRGVVSTIAAIDNYKKGLGLKESVEEMNFFALLAESTADEALEMVPGCDPVDPECKDAVDALKDTYNEGLPQED